MENERNNKKRRARNRVEQLKGFYIHALVYVIINLFLIGATVFARMNAGEGFIEALFNFGTLATALFWGIGLAFHAAKTFGYSPLFSKDWEERKIKEYMEEDRREAEKFSKK